MVTQSCRRCSESQKIGHVTFFWNGNRGGPFNKDLEKYKEVRKSFESALEAEELNM